MLKQKKIFYLFLILSGFFEISNPCFAQVKIAVLYSNQSELNSPTNSKNIIEAITSWELLLMQNNISYKVIYDEDLESGIEDEYDILILPSVEFISKTEMIALQNFLASGKSIISVGSKLFYPKSNTNDLQNLEALLGLSNINIIPEENISYLQSISPNHLNHFVVDDDPVLQISASNKPMMCDEVENKCFNCGYILFPSNNISNKSSIVYGTVERGKYLWTGFELNDVVSGKNDLEQFKNLILNTIIWMDNNPDIYLKFPWNGGLGPSLLTLEFNNSLEPRLVDVLQKNNFNPNIIVNPQQKISKEVLSKFSDDRIILDLSGNNYDQYGNPESAVNLIITSNLDNEITVNTILVKQSFLENNELKSLTNIGIENILLLSEITGSPKQSSENLFILPFSKTGINSESYGLVRFIHYVPKINCDENSEDEFLAVLNQVDKEQFDFTSLKEISEWWKIKNKLDAKIISVIENGIEVLITNKNSIEVDNLQLYINANSAIDEKNVSVLSNNILLKHYFQRSTSTMVVSLDKLLPNSSNKITISVSEN